MEEKKTDKKQQKEEHHVLHTPGGEMPNPDQEHVGKEPLTDEDRKKAS